MILVDFQICISVSLSYEKCFFVKENMFDKVDLYINEILEF